MCDTVAAEMAEDEKVLAYWVGEATRQKRRADEAQVALDEANRRLAEEWANMDATMKGWDALCSKSTEAEDRAENAERRSKLLEDLLRNWVSASEHLRDIRSQATWIQMGHDQGGIDAMNRESRARIEASAALLSEAKR